MKTNSNSKFQKNLRRTSRWLFLAALISAAGLNSACQDTYDLDEKLPPNFGANLMNYLEENNFTQYAQLAKDLNYENELSGVALKTVLAADDNAFDRFFKSNNLWGVHSYEELTTAQKKLLFYNTMLDNSLQVMNLSSTSGNQEAKVGNAMRRTGSGTVFDSIPVLRVADYPENNPHWDYYRKNRDSMVCMMDMTARPILFFTEPFLQAKRITNSDIDFLYNIKNGEEGRKSGDATIGSTFIAEGNIRLPNGFIHRTQEVVTPLDNMAEIIRKGSNTKIFSRILERFSAPYYAGYEATQSYNNGRAVEIDSLFEKRYFAERSKGGAANKELPNDGPEVEAYLRFDPGWNSYFSDSKGEASQTVAMQSDMGVMLVPTDSAMMKYWNGTGAVIRNYYHHLDSVPNKIWAELINNGMLNSWVNSVPSKFNGIVNSNQDRMGIQTSDVDSVILGCNGAVYLTNKVFAPTSFVSVTCPALINETMNIFYWAIKQLQYYSYLNSLDSYYSFFIPTNNALLVYYDPFEAGKSMNQMWKFHYDEEAAAEDDRVWAEVYEYKIAKDSLGKYLGEIRNSSLIKDRLEDLLDTHIIIGKKSLTEGGIPQSYVQDGHEFYRTKNGGIIAMKQEGDNWYVQGTYQRDKNKWLKVTQIYDQSVGGNGMVYILDGEPGEAEPIMTTRKSAIDILAEHEEFSAFYDLLDGSSLKTDYQYKMSSVSAAGNLSVFNNFNYTIYVPTNESLAELFKEENKAKYGLYTWEEIEETRKQGDESKFRTDSIRLESFIRYHIQDNLLMIGLDYANDGAADFDENGHVVTGDTFKRNYETAYMNPLNKKFCTVEVSATPGSLSIKDAQNNVRQVLKKYDAENRPLYNLTGREYWLYGSSIDASSTVAIHLIDGPLLY